MTHCPLCTNKCTVVEKSFPGYAEDTFFTIWECQSCKSQSIHPEKVDYDALYQNEQYPWYTIFVRTAKEHHNPLQKLSRVSSIYKPIYDLLKGVDQELKILDVACGYGYIVHSLNTYGHSATGIDISSVAIDNATKTFGVHFQTGSWEYITEQYDLIIATEIIEHLPRPRDFIQTMMNHLNTNGRLLLTTPNKDFYTKLNPRSVWKTDLPPVHQTWISRQGITDASKPYKVNFYTYPLYYTDSYFNLLLETRAAYNKYTPVPKITLKENKPVFTYAMMKKMLKTSVGNHLSTIISRVITRDYPVLSCIVEKNNIM